MKKTLKFIAATLILAAMPVLTCYVASKSAIPVTAEASEEVSLVEEESESSSEEKPSAIDQIVIDGKTIEQWKKELADENTRMSALIALVAFAIGGVLFVIKWLTERGLLKKNNVSAETLKAHAESFAASDENFAKLLSQVEEKMKHFEQVVDEKTKLIEQVPEKAEEAISSVKEEVKALNEVMLLVTSTDPNLVANDAYKKTKEILEKHGYGENK